MIFPFFIHGNARIFHAMGYFKDQEGIVRRYLREKEAWSSHLENTKSFILQSAKNKDKNKAAILGSGWLLDIPIEKLSKLFGEIWLFDIKHPEQIKRKVEKLGNIKLLETDISGLAIPLYKKFKEHSRNGLPLEFDLNKLQPQFNFDFSDFSFVASCNMLNQLDIILLDYLRNQHNVPLEIENEIRKVIQDIHLQILPKSKTCLITDVNELWIDNNDSIRKQQSLIYTANLPAHPSKKWIWNFDSHYRYRDNYKTKFEVYAFDL